MSQELLRLVDGICRDKNIEKELVLQDLELAMESAVRKANTEAEDIHVEIDRLTGDIQAIRDGEAIDMRELGRIAAQTAKQVMIQKLREAERGSIFEEFSQRKGTILTGVVQRFEGGALVVSIGRSEGFLPRGEQIPGESHSPGERIRVLLLDVQEAPHQVRIILSRSHPDFIRRLFDLEVPEVAERIIEIKALAREAGYRTKVAVTSIDTKVDAVGACVGVRGSRIKNIVDELAGEKIDIVRWNESSQVLIGNSLKPAEVQEIALCFELGRATVVVGEDQLSLAIGKRGQNVRLGARLTGWDIDILTPAEYNKGLDDLEKTLRSIEGVEDVMIDKLVAMGMISLMDIDEVGVDPLVSDLGMTQELAERVVRVASEQAAHAAEEMKKVRAQAEKERADRVVAERASAQAALAALRGDTPATTDSSEAGAPETELAETELSEESAQADASEPVTDSGEGDVAEAESPDESAEAEAEAEAEGSSETAGDETGEASSVV